MRTNTVALSALTLAAVTVALPMVTEGTSHCILQLNDLTKLAQLIKINPMQPHQGFPLLQPSQEA